MKRRSKQILWPAELLVFLILVFFFNCRNVQCKTDIIDAQKYFEASSIAVDSNGNPHFAYIGDYLYYAFYNGINWQYMTVDSSPLGSGCVSIALDTEGKAHISYFDIPNRILKYATNSSGAWQIYNLYSTGELGYSTNIALDSKDNVHIIYISDLSNNTLKYATNASGIWKINIIDNSGDAGWQTSIAIDSKDNVHISYNDSANMDLKYATNTSGVWETYIVDDSGGSYMSIALDSSDNVHISYNYSTNYLKYTTNVSGQWKTYTIDSGAVGEYASMVTDTKDNIHISYHDHNNFRLKYATNASGGWETSTIGYGGWRTSISADSEDQIHISHFNSSKSELRYSTNISGEWETSVIDTAGSVGMFTSLIIDSSDNIHISYHFSCPEYDLKYAAKVDGIWNTYTIDSIGEVGEFTSIALDSADNVHISYCNHSLRYFTNATGVWYSRIIDSSGIHFRHSSIALDSNDKVHISYYVICSDCGDEYQLRYATDVSGSWKTYIIDSGYQYVGEYASIALDSHDKVHISYFDGTQGAPKYATNVSGVWETYTIDDSGFTGWYSSIAIDSKDNIHISYCDYSDSTDKKLRYASFISGVWKIVDIDYCSTDFGHFPCIAIDSEDNVHICYNNEDLKYANNVSGEWKRYIVNKVGKYPSMAFDSEDRLHISYFNDITRDLNYETDIEFRHCIEVSPLEYDFGEATRGTSSTPMIINISNTGNEDLEITNINLSNNVDFSFDINGGPNPLGGIVSTIIPDSSASIGIIFKPASIGKKITTLTISSDDPKSPSVNIFLTGRGAAKKVHSYNHWLKYNWGYPTSYNSLHIGGTQDYSRLWTMQDYITLQNKQRYYLLYNYPSSIYNQLYNYTYINYWNKTILNNRSSIKTNLFNSYNVPSGFLTVPLSSQYEYFASIYSELDILKFMPFNVVYDDSSEKKNATELIDYPTEPIIYDLEGDYYYFGESKERKDLNRIKNEIAIKGDQEKIDKIIELLLPEKSFDKQSIFRNYHEYQFEDVSEGDFTTRMINILKNYSEIEFISPVFISASYLRSVLTEEIIIKLKEGYGENDLIAINLPNIQIKKELLPRVHVLTVNNAKERDILEIARWYAEFYIIEWAEPNFIGEIRFGSP